MRTMAQRNYRAEVVAGMDASLRTVAEGSVQQLTNEIAVARRIFFTGAGRSFLALKCLAMALMQIGYEVHATGDVSTPSIEKGDLLIVASASGETKSVVLFVDQARSSGARIVAITSNPSSAMGRLADLVVEMGDGAAAVKAFGGWKTGSFFELALAPLGDCIVETLATATGATAETIAHSHANME